MYITLEGGLGLRGGRGLILKGFMDFDIISPVRGPGCRNRPKWENGADQAGPANIGPTKNQRLMGDS